MSTTIVFNGTNYVIPAIADASWGTAVSNYLIAIASGAFQKTAGAFTLTAEANFGATYGLKVAYLKSTAAAIAADGVVRLGKTDTVSWRNNANGADLALAVNGSDKLTFNGVTLATLSGGLVLPSLGGTGVANNDASTLTISGSYATTLTVTGITGVTLPTSGTLATLAGSETFTNKTLTSPTLTTPALGTPSSGNLSSCTAYPVASLANLGTGVATFLATPSSANLAAALTDETGSGAAVFGTSPSLTTPTIGSAGANFSGSSSGTTALKALATASGTLTLPAATDTLVGKATTDTLTNKTLTGNTAVNLISGSGTLTLNTTGTVTLPNATDTLVGKATTDTLTNKTLSGNTAVTLISGSGTLTLNTTGTATVPNATDTLVGKATTDTLTNKTLTSAHIGTSLLFNGTSSGTMTMAPAAAITDYTITWPAAQGGASTVLTNNGSGTLSWGAGLTTALTSGHLFVGNVSNVATDTAITGDVTISNAGVTALASSFTGAKTFTNGIVFGSGGSNLNNFQVSSTGSTFTFDGTGSPSASASMTMRYQRIGDWVYLHVPGINATTVTSSINLTANTALDTFARPSASSQYGLAPQMKNNGAIVTNPGQITVTTGGIVSFQRDCAATAFTNASSCGPNQGFVFSYYVGTGS